jgi:hypothetical protein
MSRSVVRRTAVLFVLSVLLAAPWSAAAPRQIPRAAPAPLVSRLWSRLTVLWSDIGCIIDPNGLCHGSAATQSDIGCGLDPHGICHGSAASQSDIGCGIDPGGACHGSVAPQGDIGCIADPSGACRH